MPVPQSPDQLWDQIVFPYVDEQLRTIPSRAPEGLLPTDFHSAYIGRAREAFDGATKKKRDFQDWTNKIKDWESWAHDLIPYEEIAPSYVSGRWQELCYKEHLTDRRPSGLAPDTVRRLLHKRPFDMDTEDFFNELLADTCVRFMKQYFSSYQEPMVAWLYNLAASAAEDFPKKHVPGYRFKDKKIKPKFVSIDHPPAEGDEGGSHEIAHDTKQEPHPRDTLLVYNFLKATLKTGWGGRFREQFAAMARDRIAYADSHIARCSECEEFLRRGWQFPLQMYQLLNLGFGTNYKKPTKKELAPILKKLDRLVEGHRKISENLTARPGESMSTVKTSSRVCGLCKKPGHNRRSCQEKTDSMSV